MGPVYNRLRLTLLSVVDWYVRESDYLRHISSPKIHLQKNEISSIWREQGRWAMRLDTPDATVNIFVAGTNRSSIHNKTRGTRHQSGYLMRCL